MCGIRGRHMVWVGGMCVWERERGREAGEGGGRLHTGEDAENGRLSGLGIGELDKLLTVEPLGELEAEPGPERAADAEPELVPKCVRDWAERLPDRNCGVGHG